MEFPDPSINRYAEAHTTGESELLQQLTAETVAEVPMPNMLSGHLQGRLLALLSWLVQPKVIIEIGTYTGYSGLCLTEGLLPEGVLHTIDVDEDVQQRAKRYFQKAGILHQVNFHLGDAREVIPAIAGTFDLVFIDANKTAYPDYFDMVVDRVRKGGLIIADNVLWSGRVLETVQDKRTQRLHEYNEKVLADERVTTLLLPVRDGLNIAQKIV